MLGSYSPPWAMPGGNASTQRVSSIYVLACTRRLDWPRWRGPVEILSTVAQVDWILLGPGESIKGSDLRQTLLVADAPYSGRSSDK